MKTYTRHKTLDEVKNACKQAGFVLDTSGYDERGLDHVIVDFVHGDVTYQVFYASFNGRFFGKEKGSEDCTENYFSSDNGDLDILPWFRALLDFFYVGETPEKEE
ncbi:MAG: hypothetical protein HY055_09650 [Magnetospirillum sp.]|nr:hypothetical protein [Magnetospirillum sp.]